MNREKAGLPEPVAEEKAKATETKELPKKVTGLDDFLYKSEKTVDFSKPSKEEMTIENSKTPFDDDPVSPLAKKEPTTTETIEEVVTPVKDTPEVTNKQKVSPVKKTYEEYKADHYQSWIVSGICPKGNQKTVHLIHSKVQQ